MFANETAGGAFAAFALRYRDHEQIIDKINQT